MLRAAIEQAAVHCATNPGFVHALRAASAAAGIISENGAAGATASPYQFMTDPAADGYTYFNWYLELCRQRLSGSLSGLVHPGTPAARIPPAPFPPPAALQHSFHPPAQLGPPAHFRPPSFHRQVEHGFSTDAGSGILPLASRPVSGFHPPQMIPNIPHMDFSASTHSTVYPSCFPHNVPLPQQAASGVPPPPPPARVSTGHSHVPLQPLPAQHLANLVSQYAEAPLPPLSSLHSATGDTEAKTAALLQRTTDFITSASVTLVGCATLDAGITTILPFYPPFVAASPDYKTASHVLRLRAEETQSFVGRLSLSLLSYILMTTGNVKMEWRSHLLPYFIWILRLTYVAGDTPQEKSLLTALVQRAFEGSVITPEQRVAFLTLLECPHIPGVAAVFNTPLISVSNGKPESRRKFRFDSPTAPAPPPPPSLPAPISVEVSECSHAIADSATLPSSQLALSNYPPPPPPMMSPQVSRVLPQPHNQQVTGIFSLPFVPTHSASNAIPRTGGETNSAFLPIPTASPPVDPDRIPGGILATLLKQVSKRGRHLQAAFVPYRPLDSFLIPAAAPLSVSAPTDYLMDRLADLQDDIDTAFHVIASEAAKRRAAPASRGNTSRTQENRDAVDEDYARSKEESSFDSSRPPAKKKRATREFRERGSGLTSYGEASWEKPVAWAQAEMGISEDGTLLGESGADRLGLGASSKTVTSSSAADNLFNDYRKHRAHKYHKTIAQAHADRVQEELQDPSRLCFICQKSGHLARECKFGMT